MSRGSRGVTSSVGYQESFRELTVAHRDTCLLVPRTKPVVSAWPWLELPGLRLTRPAEALLTHSMRRCLKSSTQSLAVTRSGQHRSGTRRGTFWLVVRSVLCCSSASQPGRGSRMPATVSLRSLVPSSLLLRQPQPLYSSRQHSPSEAQGRHPPHRLQ